MQSQRFIVVTVLQTNVVMSLRFRSGSVQAQTELALMFWTENVLMVGERSHFDRVKQEVIQINIYLCQSLGQQSRQADHSDMDPYSGGSG